MSEKITAIIIAKNAERTIAQCVQALAFCDRVLAGENGSTDRTVELAKAAGAQVKNVAWEGYGLTKNRLIDEVKEGWILSIDADEIVTPELTREIRARVEQPDGNAGFWLSRRNFFLNRHIKGCGWAPDLQLRLFKAGQGRFEEKAVHERLLVGGRLGRLKAPLDHYSYPSIADYMERLNHYTTLAAQDRLARGKKLTRLRWWLDPWWTFTKMYFLKAGFRDGFPGLVLCLLSAYNTFIKHSKHWELLKQAAAEGVPSG